MGTGNYVTTLSGRNQQSNLDKIDNWETTRKYLFDRISLYTAYSLILQIYFQRNFKCRISIYVKRRDFKRKNHCKWQKSGTWIQSLLQSGSNASLQNSGAAHFFQFERCYVYFEKHQGGILWFILKNTREEKEKKAHDMETLPLKSTINYEWHTLICNFFRISIIMIDNIMISSIKWSPPSTINIQSALFRISNHSILNI